MEGAHWMDIRSDHNKELNYTEIARKYNIDTRTAKKYASSETRPVYSLTEAKPSKLDPYKQQINIWLEEAPYSATRIWEKLKEQGFTGGYTVVKQYVGARKSSLKKKQLYVSKPCPDSRYKSIGRSLKTTRSMRRANGNHCTVF